jgi:hypothetical protein
MWAVKAKCCTTITIDFYCSNAIESSSFKAKRLPAPPHAEFCHR